MGQSGTFGKILDFKGNITVIPRSGILIEMLHGSVVDTADVFKGWFTPKNVQRNQLQ